MKLENFYKILKNQATVNITFIFGNYLISIYKRKTKYKKKQYFFSLIVNLNYHVRISFFFKEKSIKMKTLS
jgi:hypothetical protein